MVLNDKDKYYIPPLRYRWLTPLYDTITRVTSRELTVKQRLVYQASIEKGHRVLDVGCGTATLTILIKKIYPESDVFGLDSDSKVLEIAKAKIVKTGLDIVLDLGMAYELPYESESFDRVLSSLAFHHLTRKNKRQTLKEIFRVLRKGGELHIADAGKAQNWLMRGAFLLVQLLDGFETTTDNVKGLLPEFMSDAGFEEVEETTRYLTVLGTFSLYRARKPIS